MSSNAFYPSLVYINAISNDQQAVVGFTTTHDFTIGEIVSFRCTAPFGMVEINNQSGLVLAMTSMGITVGINTSTWTPFNYGALNMPKTTPPTCLPSSSGIPPGLTTPATNLEDAFDNLRV